MWRIDSEVEDAGAPYDRRAAAYDRLVRSRLYNRIAWGSSPEDYARFAATAFTSSTGALLEVAAGSAAATAALHASSQRPAVLVDLSRPMLERAAERIVAAGSDRELPSHIRLVQADLFGLPVSLQGFATILGLGVSHLFDNLPDLVGTLRQRLAPDGQLYLAGLVAETRRGRRYLQVLHRAGEVAEPMTAEQLRAALGNPASFYTRGCMAYAALGG